MKTNKFYKSFRAQYGAWCDGLKEFSKTKEAEAVRAMHQDKDADEQHYQVARAYGRINPLP